MLEKINPTETNAWEQLQHHFSDLGDTQMKTFFTEDTNRFSKFSIWFAEILVDYSKNIITDETLEKLLNLADETGVKPAIEAMFSAGKINETEGREVLHTTLRNQSNAPVMVGGEDVMPAVNAGS